jgi:lipid-A-disaccharide synthase-like uncharacterized protein
MQPTKRLKWEPGALMVLVLGLGLWIAFGPASKPKFATDPNALTQDVRIGNTRGLFEAYRPVGASEFEFRLWVVGKPDKPESMDRARAEKLLGPALVQETVSASHNQIFKWLNITSYASLVWVGVGLIGQLAFSGRMVIQWLTSEKHRKSVITESFWWFSLFGGVTLFSYFIWRQDPVAILGQASGIVIYIRNIRLLRKHARRARRDALIAGSSSDVGGSV